VNSIASSFDESEVGMTSSFSGSSSYAVESSVPSTPGYTSGPHVHGTYGQGCGYMGGGPASPGVMGLETMGLGGCRLRSSVVGLLDGEEGVGLDGVVGKGKGVGGDVKIVGMDVEVERRMDVDG